jgi:hypothetical protein
MPREGGFPTVGVAELFLGLGLVSLTAALGLSQFVIVGLLGIGSGFLALIFLAVAIILARDPAASLLQSAAGLVVTLVGLALLTAAAGQAVTVAYDRARHAWQPFGPAPTDLLWPWAVLAGPAAAAVFASGLWLWAGWLNGRLWLWAAAAALVGPVAVFVFMALVTPSLLDA